jgi:hypothetical protein
MTLVFFCVGYHNLLINEFFSAYAGSMNMTIPANGSLQNVTMQQPTALTVDSVVIGVAHSILSNANIETALALGILGLAGAFVALNYLSGFSANFLVPALIIIVVMNFLFFPISIITDASLPLFLKFFVFVVYNTFTIIATIDFIRGGM